MRELIAAPLPEPEHRLALSLQFGDLRTYQLQAVERAKYPGSSVRRKRIAERRPQRLQARAPVSPKRIVIMHPQGCHHSANTIDQTDPVGHQILPFPDAPAFILIGFVGNGDH